MANNIEGAIPNKKVAGVANLTGAGLDRKITADAIQMNNAITKLESKIIADANALSTSGGNLLGPKVNLKQAQKLHTSLTQMFDETYGASVRAHISGYSDVEDLILNNFEALDVAANWTDIDKTMINQLKQQSVVDFVNIGSEAQARITQSLYNSIAAQAPMEDFIGEISAALTGHLSQNGKPLSSYAELYANDSVMNFYNNVSVDKGRQLGMNNFFYSGTVMANTRDFCSRRVGKAYSQEQIESWDYKWAGKSGPALTHRGGWNCRHHWQPVREEWLDGEALADSNRPWEDLSIPERFHRMNVRGMAVSPEEKLFKKRLNQLRYNLKTGKPFKPDSNLGKMWYNIPTIEREKLVTNWAKAGIDIPDVMGELLIKNMPPANFVTIPNTIVPKAPPKVKPPKVPPKPPKKQPKVWPEDKIAPIPDADAYPGGLNWDELDAKQKKDMGQMGYNFKVGKKFSPNSQVAKTWDVMSYEAQQTKLLGWKSKGFDIPSNLPIKGEGQVLTNIVPTPPGAWQSSNLKTVSKQFEDKFKFSGGSTTTGYTAAEEAQILNDLGKHWDDMLYRHPKIAGYLDEGAKINVGDTLKVANSDVVGGGAAGVFNDASGVLELAGQLSKKGTISVGKGGWSVGGDFFTVSRHEFGHYVDNVLRKMQDWPSKTSTKFLGFNHQSEWRKLYKKHQNQWETLFGKYSTADKYEGFAEAFAAYTSPDYKKGMMPKDVESYLKKLLGGKGKAVIPKVPKAPKIPKKPNALFKNIDHEDMYDDFYKNYRIRKLTKTEIKDEIRAQCPELMDILQTWQGSTQGKAPSALKLKAELMEARDDLKFFTRKGTTYDMSQLLKDANAISDEEYIRIRALTQEYYDRTNKKGFVKLSRGTDGQNSGPAFRNKVNYTKSQYDRDQWPNIEVELREPAINGWSTGSGTANSFGLNGGGITTTTKIPTKDIFISDELWPKWSYKGEREWLIFRSESQVYPLSDIRSQFGSGVAKVVEPVKQGVKDAIDKLPKHIGGDLDDPENPIFESVSLYIQNTPGWKNLSSDEMVKKLEKKYNAISKAIAEGDPAYIFPGKIVNEDILEVLDDVTSSIKQSNPAAWTQAVENYEPELFFGEPIELVGASTGSLSKDLYNISNNASPLPDFVSNQSHLKTLTVKVLDDFNWEHMSTPTLKEQLVELLLGYEMDIDHGASLVVHGHKIAGDVSADFIDMMHQMIDHLDEGIGAFKKAVDNTTLIYY